MSVGEIKAEIAAVRSAATETCESEAGIGSSLETMSELATTAARALSQLIGMAHNTDVLLNANLAVQQASKTKLSEALGRLTAVARGTDGLNEPLAVFAGVQEGAEEAYRLTTATKDVISDVATQLSGTVSLLNGFADTASTVSQSIEVNTQAIVYRAIPALTDYEATL